MKTRRLILSLFIMGISISSSVLAMTFNQPQKIGSYSNTRAGGSSKATASGYTRATKDSFIFGTGDDALIFKYKNTSTVGEEHLRLRVYI